MGLEHRDNDRLTEALAAFEAARVLREQVVDDPGALGMTLHEIAWIRAARGHLAEALELYQLARATKERQPPSERERWNDYSTTLHELGFVLARIGRLDEAAAAYEDSLAASVNIVDPALRLAADASTLRELAQLRVDAADWPTAKKDLHRWLALFPGDSGNPADVARALYLLAFVNFELKSWKEARASINESLRLFESIPPEDRNNVHHTAALTEARTIRAASKNVRPARTRAPRVGSPHPRRQGRDRFANRIREEKQMTDYMLLMHDDAHEPISEASWGSYIGKLRSGGHFEGGSSFGAGACVNKDGPAKDITRHLGGFMRIRADDLEHAKALLAGNPVFEAGGTVEIRELIED